MSGRKILTINIIFIKSDWINGIKIINNSNSPIIIDNDKILKKFLSYFLFYQSQSHDQSRYLTNITKNLTSIVLTDTAESIDID